MKPLNLMLCALLLAPVTLLPAASGDLARWERSLVTLEVNSQGYNYIQPWTRRSQSTQKSGVVIGPRSILTTAEQLNDLLLARVQKGGRGRWYPAQLEWIDYHANLALLTSDDEEFWQGLRPASLMTKIPLSGDARVLRWREGKIEARKMEINRARIETGRQTFIDIMHLELNGEVPGVGFGEPVIDGSRIIGIMEAPAGSGGLAVPAPFIKSVLDARAKDDYRGLGFFNFYWQRAENPETLKALKMEQTDHGVIVIQPLAKIGEESILKARDVILEIDGFEIGPEGDYQDPIYGRTMLEALATRGRWAGDGVPMTIWRDGRQMEIEYKLPKAEFTDEMIPDKVFDQPPEYLIAGGFVFQPLTVPYLESWGGDWQRRAPFRLAYLKQAIPTEKQEALVVLSVVLPDPYNLGYQSIRGLLVREINGRKIVRLPDIEAALKEPRDGFHIIEFARGDSPGKIVLDAGDLSAATARVLQRYGIDQDRLILGDSN
ncbi:MAG TPA: hypothetical protein VLD18_13605 [Verrucomicrobiae bacterium]|nr:hypothetical protein [Verrucomicrobiae bacterium]